MASWPPINFSTRPPLGTAERLIADFIVTWAATTTGAVNSAATRQQIWNDAMESDLLQQDPRESCTIEAVQEFRMTIAEWEASDQMNPVGLSILREMLLRQEMEVAAQYPPWNTGRPGVISFRQLTTDEKTRYLEDRLQALEEWERSELEAELKAAEEDLRKSNSYYAATIRKLERQRAQASRVMTQARVEKRAAEALKDLAARKLRARIDDLVRKTEELDE
jgi:hypothetical protein